MKIKLLFGIMLLLSIPLLSNEIEENSSGWSYEEEIYKIKPTKLEKAEAELEYMNERVDFYKRVVRSIEREEAELKELRKLRIKKTR